ncbi:hypothetical protein ARMSODRAFT_978775 [Armillaria solidipes]|uniref:Uncharacterized protein n=1 Tax=Armillaria solidipes TaxID=1076256 RepID=A0A2H3BJR2_9AGAR|nr:hypothetical protein ARMSODRAFT_978775 [Armillaria solidipes]
MEALKKEIIGLRNRVEALEEEITKLKGENAKLKGENADLKSRVEALETEVVKLSAFCLSLRGQLGDVADEAADMEIWIAGTEFATPLIALRAVRFSSSTSWPSPSFRTMLLEVNILELGEEEQRSSQGRNMMRKYTSTK